MIERSTVVRVKDGLHARPATQFVKLAKTFVSDVEVRRGEMRANAKSSVKLMLLALKQDETVTVRADGADAEEALSCPRDLHADAGRRRRSCRDGAARGRGGVRQLHAAECRAYGCRRDRRQ